MTTLAVPL